jgi:citrate lyase subunit beta/citryl-CoA lyase
MTPPRSYLFVPGNRPERFAKACASGADAVIIDLEDAVPSAERLAARQNTASWLSAGHPVYIRINGADTEWFREDLAICGGTGVAGVVLPKAERVEDIQTIGIPVLPIIETARGFWNVSALAHAPNVRRLLFGSIDFQVDLGIAGEGEELLYFRSQLVLVSRIAGLPSPVDGITTSFDSQDAVRADTRRARRWGLARSSVFTRNKSPPCMSASAPPPKKRHGPGVSWTQLPKRAAAPPHWMVR